MSTSRSQCVTATEWRAVEPVSTQPALLVLPPVQQGSRTTPSSSAQQQTSPEDADAYARYKSASLSVGSPSFSAHSVLPTLPSSISAASFSTGSKVLGSRLLKQEALSSVASSNRCNSVGMGLDPPGPRRSTTPAAPPEHRKAPWDMLSDDELEMDSDTELEDPLPPSVLQLMVPKDGVLHQVSLSAMASKPLVLVRTYAVRTTCLQ